MMDSISRVAVAFLLVVVAPSSGVSARSALRSIPSQDSESVSIQPMELTLAEAVELALQFDPTVRSARAGLDRARARLTTERGDWIPDLSLVGSATRYQEPTLVYPIHSFSFGSFPPFDRTVLQGGLFLDYTLFDGGARIQRVRGAGRTADAALAVFEGTESAIIAKITTNYLEILTRGEVLEAYDRRLEALQSEQSRVLQFRDVGRAAALESLRVAAALSAARAHRVRLEAKLSEAERDLAALTGIPEGRTSVGSLRAVHATDRSMEPVDTLVARADRASPAIREAEQNAAASRAVAGAARATRLPTLGLAGGYQVWSDPEGDSSDEWNVAVRLRQAIFTGGELSGRIREAEAVERRGEEALRMARIDTWRAVRKAIDRVREADAGANSLQVAVARYVEVTRIEALALQAGTGTQTDFLSAEAELFDARAALAEARRAKVMARVELARLTGSLTRDWLTRNLEVER